MALRSLSSFILFLIILAKSFAQDDFTHEVLLDRANEFWFRWSYTGDSIDILVSAKTQGWLAFGFSASGGMDKADVMFGFINDSSGRANVSDRYLLADNTNVQLVLDKQQDWELLTATKNQSHISIRVRRKLETCDQMDYPITKDTVNLIFSVDQQVPKDFLHPTIHDFRGKRNLLLLDDSLAVRKLGIPITTHATMEWNVLMDGVVIPESVTSRFHCKLVKIPPFNRKFHVIKVEPRVDEENVDLVRQMLVSICSADIVDNVQPSEFMCGIERFGDHGNPQQSSILRNCTTLLAAWAVGASSFVYPEDVGYPVGPELSGRFVLLQAQYINTPLQRRVDSSGLKFGLSDKLRKNEAGILLLGVAGDMIIPPNPALFTHFGQCTDLCTSQALPEDGVTIFGGNFHSNGQGRKMKLRHIRDGVELPPMAQDDNFEPSYQEYRGIYPLRKLLRGDELILECSYSRNPLTSRRTSSATTDEICLGTVIFHPRINLTSCQSAYQVNLGSAIGLTAAGPSVIGADFSNVSLSENVTASVWQTSKVPDFSSQLASFIWTAEKVGSLQASYRDWSFSTLCQFENGYDFSEIIRRTEYIPTQRANSTCAVLAGLQTIDTPIRSLAAKAKSSGNSVKRRDATLASASMSFLSFLSAFFFLI